MWGRRSRALTETHADWQTKDPVRARPRLDKWTCMSGPSSSWRLPFSDLQRGGHRYQGGMALRLARVKRYREERTNSSRRQTTWTLYARFTQRKVRGGGGV